MYDPIARINSTKFRFLTYQLRKFDLGKFMPLTLKRLWEVKLTTRPPCGFSKNLSSKENVKTRIFVTLILSKSHLS